MKHLFKNAFKSLASSKVAMILLGIIIFFSSAVITLMSSSGAAFEKSYHNIVESNNLHDFTSKEKYKTQGDLVLKQGAFQINDATANIGDPVNRVQSQFNIYDPKSKDPKESTKVVGTNVRKVKLTAPDDASGWFSPNHKYIYFKGLGNMISLKDHNKNIGSSKQRGYVPNPIIRMDMSKMRFIDYDQNGNIDSIQVLDDSLSFDIAIRERATAMVSPDRTNRPADVKGARNKPSVHVEPLGEWHPYEVAHHGWWRKTYDYSWKWVQKAGTVPSPPIRTAVGSSFDWQHPENWKDKDLNGERHDPFNMNQDMSIFNAEVEAGAIKFMHSNKFQVSPYSSPGSLMDTNSDPAHSVFSDSEAGLKISLDSSWEALIQKMKQISSAIFKLQDTEAVDITYLAETVYKKDASGNIKLDADGEKEVDHYVGSTGIYQEVLNNPASRKFVDEEIHKIGLDYPFPISGANTEAQIDSAKETFQNFLKNISLRNQRTEYKAQVMGAYGNEIDIREQNSVNVVSDKTSFKVVSSSNNEKIDTLDVLDGYQLPDVYDRNKLGHMLALKTFKDRAINGKVEIADGHKFAKINSVLGKMSKSTFDMILRKWESFGGTREDVILSEEDEPKVREWAKGKSTGTISGFYLFSNKKGAISDADINELKKLTSQNLGNSLSITQLSEVSSPVTELDDSAVYNTLVKAKKGNPLAPQVAHLSKVSLDDSKSFKTIARWSNIMEAIKGGLGGIFALAAGGITHAGLNHESPLSESIINPSAYFAYVSPGYYNAHKDDIKFIDPQDILGDPTNLNQLLLDPKPLFEKYSDSVIEIGKDSVFVIGSAVQPDYAFPIFSGAHPIPNSKSEAIIFTNGIGYDRINDEYRNNEHENYLAFKFKPGVSNARQDEIIDGIEEKSRKLMTWPNNIRIVSRTMDTTEQVLLAPQRVAFLTKIKKMVGTITFMTSALLLAAVALIVMLVAKKEVNTKKKNLAILMANGYSKFQVSFANTVMGLMVGAIPALAGYITGHFLQYIFMDIFADYWTIPLVEEAFSWRLLIIMTVVPVLGIALLVFLISMWELRGKLTTLLSGGGSKVSNALSAKVVSPLKWVGIKTRISLSIFFTNLSKMMMMLVSTAISITIATIAFTSMGKFGYAREQSIAKNKYTFMIPMETPTNEGGLITRVDPMHASGDLTKSPTEILKGDWGHDDGQERDYNVIHNNHPDWGTANPNVEKSTIMIPNTADEMMSQELTYLKYRFQIMSLLNVNVGAGTNPWQTTGAPLMPEGTRIAAENRYLAFLKLGTSKVPSKKDPKNLVSLIPANDTYRGEQFYIDASKGKEPDITYNMGHPNEAYIKFVLNTLKFVSENIDQYAEFYPYAITYNHVIAYKEDETYTRIQTEYTIESIDGRSDLSKTDIVGVNPDTTMIEFDGGTRSALKGMKIENGQVPVVINKYMAEVYNLSVGDTFNIKVTNPANRRQIEPANLPTRTVKVEAIDISYNDAKIYTTQSIANQVLGLDKLAKAGTKPEEVFNGIFTKSDKPITLLTLPLYAESGVYPASDTIVKGSSIYNAINSEIKKDTIGEFDSNGNQIGHPIGHWSKNPLVKNINDYLNYYSNSAFVMAFNNPDWAAMSAYTFDSTLELSNKLILLVESIALLIAILFTVIISSMLISDNKKFIATLKVMGYRQREVSRTFFSSMLPAILVAIAIAIPISFGLLLAMKVAIVGFGHILIPLNMVWWEPILAVISVLMFTWIVYWFSTRSMKTTSILSAF